MIVKSEAIEPKAGKATSIYPAVIVNIVDSNTSNIFVNLQVFCPDVMSGSVIDAKFAANNWLEAPKKPHNGADNYNYTIGGVVMISYQNGNLASPQFVRYIDVSENIISQNKKYIDGLNITHTDVVVSITDKTVSLDTDIIQKGVKLLPALQACNENINGFFHTYGYEDLGPSTPLDDKNYLTIFRCGKYGTELIFRETNTSILFNLDIDDAEMNFIEDQSDSRHDFLRICSYLLETEDILSDGNNIVDIVNSTIKEVYGVDGSYSKLSNADILYLWTSFAGYNYNKSASKLSSAFYNDVDKSAEDIKNLFGYGSVPYEELVNIYFPTYRTIEEYDIKESCRNFVDKFTSKLWKNISSNKTFDDKLASRYAIILSNNLFNLRDTYKVSSLTNKTLIICTLMMSAFPTLAKVIANFDDPDNEKYYTNNSQERSNTSLRDMTERILEYLKSSNGTDSAYNASTFASYFADLYFNVLNFPQTGYYKWEDDPYTIIYDSMKKGIQYIFDNYTKLSDYLGLNESISHNKGSRYGFIYPTLTFDTITSPFGPRTLDGEQQRNHTGIDIAGSGCYEGAAIIAVADGTVVISTFDTSGYGNLIVIKHKNGLFTYYAHLFLRLVDIGTEVKQGQKIGLCGNTGHSRGTHLHFEVRLSDKTPVDPRLGYIYND